MIERILISSADREGLEGLVRNRNTPQKVVWRARIVLLASDGLTAEAIAAAVGKSLLTVRRWRRRYVAKGVDGLLKDATRPSRVKPLSPEKIKQVVHMTLHEKPPKATHWSGRSMAAVAGISYSSVQRIWRAHGLKPHLVKTFKVSRDKHFAAKVEDVVGLYLDPPDKALVLCVDEKSQIQALDRTQPGLPMKKGRAGTMTHDYKRNGTTTLFAALNMLDGKVIGTCMPRHRHREFLRFLKLIDQQIAEGLDLHLIVDNYATHKTPAVKRWLKAHPRFHLHFTPTSASWLNMVERFFAEITRNRIRRGAFKSVAELKAAIMQYLENHNADPKPFVWTKSASQILEKVARAKQTLESQHYVHRRQSLACLVRITECCVNGFLPKIVRRGVVFLEASRKFRNCDD
jgi:transposase